MRQTVYVIPSEIAGIPVFGFGWALGLWALLSVGVAVYLAWRYGWGAELRSALPGIALSGAAIAFLLPMLEQHGGLPIRGYGVMLLLAVASGVGLSVYRARRAGIDPELILSLAFWLFVGGIVGARLFFIIQKWDRFQRPTVVETLAAMVNLTEGGLVVYGMLLTGGAVLAAFVYWHRLAGLALSDLIAPGVVLGMAIGRIGCFFTGCCYGGVCDLPWAVQFPPDSPPYKAQLETGKLFVEGLRFKDAAPTGVAIAEVEAGSPAARAGVRAGQDLIAINGDVVSSPDAAQALLLSSAPGTQFSVLTADREAGYQWASDGEAPRSLPVHPTQLYSALDALLLCLFLLAYDPYKRRDGELTALTMTIHPISRFLIEIIRTDEAPIWRTGMSISQNISLAVLVAGLGLWAWLLTQPPKVAWPEAAAAPA